MFGGEVDLTLAKCATSAQTFYPERGNSQITAREAKAVCNGEDGTGRVCPIREACLESALERRERFGIWGGMSERERAKENRRRRVEKKKRELETAKRKKVRAAAARKGWENRRRQELPSVPPSLKQCLDLGLITQGEYQQEMDHAAAKAVSTRRSKTKGNRATTTAKSRRTAA